MAQATHGSAPDIAGKIMSGKLLYEWLGRKKNEPKALQAAKFMDSGMEMVIAEAKSLTGDLGGKASTSQMGDAVVEGVRKAAAKFRS
jgi:3-isopropylmalate dehydrogenase